VRDRNSDGRDRAWDEDLRNCREAVRGVEPRLSSADLDDLSQELVIKLLGMDQDRQEAVRQDKGLLCYHARHLVIDHFRKVRRRETLFREAVQRQEDPFAERHLVTVNPAEEAWLLLEVDQLAREVWSSPRKVDTELRGA